ncbi:MAG: GxxExxY protein [Kiritimatiellales bacterium]|nr:GxxExxY protein [Kiritimatiellales bacterium]
MPNTGTHNPNLLCPELSHLVIGAAFDVHNEIGPGWNEWDYHRAMLDALYKKGVTAESHLREQVTHRGDPVDQFELDILVDNQIILEIKHIRTDFSSQHYAQIINYLKRWEKSLGILINFGMERLCYKRVPYSPVKGEIFCVGYWNDFEVQRKDLADRVHIAAQNILGMHGLGYGEETSKKILRSEFSHQELNPRIPDASPQFNGVSFEPRPMDSILLDETVLVSATAFADTTATDMARLRSGMKQLSIPFGVLINFGKSQLTLRGIKIQDPDS